MHNPNIAYYRVLVAPAEAHVAAIILGVSATSEENAIDRVQKHMETAAVNHITRLAASGVVSIDNLRYTIEES